MESKLKEVYFHEYCPNCEYWDVDCDEEPCNTCLKHGSNYNSHKPVNFKDYRDGGSKNEREKRM